MIGRFEADTAWRAGHGRSATDKMRRCPIIGLGGNERRLLRYDGCARAVRASRRAQAGSPIGIAMAAMGFGGAGCGAVMAAHVLGVHRAVRRALIGTCLRGNGNRVRRTGREGEQ